MLRLTHQVSGHDPGVRRVVSDDADLSRSGDLIYPHSTEQLPLGLCHELVAWTNDNVSLGSSEQSKGESCDTLDWRLDFLEYHGRKQNSSYLNTSQS